MDDRRECAATERAAAVSRSMWQCKFELAGEILHGGAGYCRRVTEGYYAGDICQGLGINLPGSKGPELLVPPLLR